jgi:formylglycine-generating enzyme required for sulfatase activity
VLVLSCVALTLVVPPARAADPPTEVQPPGRDPVTLPATSPARELVLGLRGDVTLNLVQIPPGGFLMGTSDEQRKAITQVLAAAGLAEDKSAEFFRDESPRHEVTIRKAFHMGITHVTVDQFAAFAMDSGHKTAAEKAGWSLNIQIGQGRIQGRRVEGASWRFKNVPKQNVFAGL